MELTNRNRLASAFLTLVIIGLLILSGPSSAINVSVSTDKGTYTAGSPVTFTTTVRIDTNELIPITGNTLTITKPDSSKITCSLPTSGTGVSVTCDNGQEITVDVDQDSSWTYGYGYGYGYGNAFGYGFGTYNWGYGYGYGYGYGGELTQAGSTTLTYTINWIVPAEYPAGTYTAALTVDTGSYKFEGSTTFTVNANPYLVNPPVLIRINEFMAYPNTSAGEYEWIELYSNDTQNLTDWTIEDNTGSTYGSGLGDTTLSGTINGYKVLNRSDVNFQLNNDADIIILKDADGVIVDQVAYGTFDGSKTGLNVSQNAPTPEQGKSIGRTADGGGTWVILNTSTPGTPNTVASANLSLVSGWNMVSIPVNVTMTANETLNLLPACNKIARYRNDGTTVGFETFLKGYAFNNFNATVGGGYFIYCNGTGALPVTGLPVSAVSDSLYTGWNLYGWVSGTNSSAQTVVDSITYSNKIARYVGGAGFETFLKGYAFNNFTVTRGSGYFIYTTNTTSWTR